MASGDTDATPKSAWRGRLRTLSVAAVLAAGLLCGGFLWFVGALPAAEENPSRKADGIVVLTGAALRINDALELLAGGYGQRLLITGVHRTTRAEEIARLTPKYQSWFSCCVDLDRTAVNTIGNAVETRRWVKERKFSSLIVVTSDFHMLRAMAELGHQLPGVELVPYPVVSERGHSGTWWSNPATAKLLISEYLKYIVAVTRIRLAFA
jgi:uncharacterized SAM-binding protein YcdF (DUF218 family)